MIFECTALAGTNKAGLLKPDNQGYYTVILGALDFPNSVGYTYVSQTALHLFQDNSPFIRRINQGYLTGECGHPKRAPGMSYDDYMVRIHTLEETNISHHISKVWLDFNQRQQYNGAVLIMGKVKPSGPKGAALLEALQNAAQNVAFSIRSFTKDDNVRRQKHLDTILTWDWVSEPGLSVANKFQNPSLESLVTPVDVPLELLQNAYQVSLSRGLGFESASNLMQETIRTQQKVVPLVASVPASGKW